MAVDVGDIKVGMKLTPVQRESLDKAVFDHGKATAIFAPEGTGPKGDLIVMWPGFGMVINPAGLQLLTKRVG